MSQPTNCKGYGRRLVTPMGDSIHIINHKFLTIRTDFTCTDRRARERQVRRHSQELDARAPSLLSPWIGLWPSGHLNNRRHHAGASSAAVAAAVKLKGPSSELEARSWPPRRRRPIKSARIIKSAKDDHLDNAVQVSAYVWTADMGINCDGIDFDCKVGMSLDIMLSACL